MRISVGKESSIGIIDVLKAESIQDAPYENVSPNDKKNPVIYSRVSNNHNFSFEIGLESKINSISIDHRNQSQVNIMPK